MKTNDNAKSRVGTSKRQGIGGSSENRDRNVEKVVEGGGNEAKYIGERIRSSSGQRAEIRPASRQAFNKN